MAGPSDVAAREPVADGAWVGAWVVVLPVKPWARAKSRLSPDPWARAAQARAFTLDVLAACSATPGVSGVVVVTSEPAMRHLSATPVGPDAGQRTAHDQGQRASVEVVDDRGSGLDDSVRLGAGHCARRWPSLGVAVLTADLPALRPEDLAVVLAAASPHRRAVVADSEGTGTTVLTAASPAELRPAFGSGSFARHRGYGAVDLSGSAAAGVRRDVDVSAHLEVAHRLGLGRHTRQLELTSN